MATSVGELQVDLSLESARFRSEMERVRRSVTAQTGEITRAIEGMRTGFERVQRGVQAIQGSLLVLFAGSVVRNALGFVANLGEMGEQAGVTAGQLYALQTAGLQSNVSIEQMQGGLERLTRKIGEAASGSDAAITAFRSIGVSILDARGQTLPTIAVLGQLADKIRSTEDPAERARIAVEAFGKTGAKFIPLLAQGADALGDSFRKIDDARVDRLSKEFDELFDKAAANAMRFKLALADVLSEARRIAGDRTLMALLGLGGGAAAGAGVGFAFGGPVGAGVGAAIGGVAGAVAGSALGMEPDEAKRRIAELQEEIAFLQKRVEQAQEAASNPIVARTLEGWRGKLTDLQAEYDRLTGKAREATAAAISESPAFVPAERVLALPRLPVSNDELKRQAQSLLEVERAAVRARTALSSDAAQKQAELRLEGQVEILDRAEAAARRLRVLSQDSQTGRVAAVVPQFDDAQRRALAAAAGGPQAAREREQLKNQLSGLQGQIAATNAAALQFDETTRSFRLDERGALIAQRTAQLAESTKTLGADQIRQAADAYADLTIRLRESTEARAAEAQAASRTRQLESEITNLTAQAAAAKSVTLEFDALTGNYRVNARELDILKKTQELQNDIAGISIEKARALATRFVAQSEAIRRATEEQQKAADQLNEFSRDFSRTLFSGFEQAVTSGNRLRDVLAGLANDLARVALRSFVTKPAENFLNGILAGSGGLGGIFGGLFGGGGGVGGDPTGGLGPAFLASGGPAYAGQPYIVGEEGPELFVPRGSGMVVPNDKLRGSSTITVNINSPDANGFRRSEQQIRGLIASAVRQGSRLQ
jgi:hypothetical protein